MVGKFRIIKEFLNISHFIGSTIILAVDSGQEGHTIQRKIIFKKLNIRLYYQ